MNDKKKICLVSPGHVGSNPRLVKEADALVEAGYEVVVISGDYMPAIRILDRSIFTRAQWRSVRISRPWLLGRLIGAVKQRVARLLGRCGISSTIASSIWAHSKMTRRLAAAAKRERSDLYIGHCLAALPAVAEAAAFHGTKFGFDAEDFHTGEIPITDENRAYLLQLESIEREYLPKCDYLTCASPLIAEAYSDHYGVKMEPILNVFPLSEGVTERRADQKSLPIQRPAFYWFSQTIGPERGLEEVVEAIGKMRARAHLYLRGIPQKDFVTRLQQKARRFGMQDRLHILAPATPSAMVRLANQYDIGLSVERSEPPNRDICLTNKIFTYLLAGIPCVLSNTAAQKRLARNLKGSVVVVDLEDTRQLAKDLDELVDDRNGLKEMGGKAKELAEKKFNWDLEKGKFLKVVAGALR